MAAVVFGAKKIIGTLMNAVPSLDLQSTELAFWRACGAAPTERFIDLVSGRRVRLQEVGEGPPILFVHGVMTSGTAFAPLAARLPGFKCILLDRPGCGLSDPWQLQAEFRDQAVETISGVLAVLGDEPVFLVGSSLGALWSTWFALAHPARVRRLVLLGASIGFPGVHVAAFMRLAAIPGVGTLMKRMMRPSPKALTSAFAAMGHGKSLAAGKFSQAFFDWGVQMAIDTPTQRNDFESIVRAVGVRGPRRWVQLNDETLHSLCVPTLFLSGTDDTHGGPALAEHAAKLIPEATAQSFRDAGHLLWLDDPSAVADALSRFCREAPDER